MTGGFTHGFTYSHHGVGAAAGRAVLAVLKQLDLVQAARDRGAQLDAALRGELGNHPAVGDIRGLGLLRGIELVSDRQTRAAFARSDRVVERVVAAGMARGVLLYSSTGCADGRDGDLVLLGPPLIITESETARTRELDGGSHQGRPRLMHHVALDRQVTRCQCHIPGSRRAISRLWSRPLLDVRRRSAASWATEESHRCHFTALSLVLTGRDDPRQVQQTWQMEVEIKRLLEESPADLVGTP